MRTLLAVLVLAPTLALAQPAEPPVPADWNIGAGIGLADLTFSSPSTGVGSLLYAPAPSVSASLERVLGDRTWLVFGVSASGTREKYDLPASASSLPAGASGTLRDQDSASGAAAVGLRGVVTPPGGFVAVSWLASFEAGFTHISQTVASASGDLSDRYDLRFVGGVLGLAVERALAERLALRLATPIARVQYGTTEQRSQMGDVTKGTITGLAVVVAPRLELRLYF
jgi:hypothetical protein